MSLAHELIVRCYSHDNSLDERTLFALAAFGGSSLTRECSRLAFKVQGRALQASDLTEQVPIAFRHLVGEAEGEPWKPADAPSGKL